MTENDLESSAFSPMKLNMIPIFTSLVALSTADNLFFTARDKTAHSVSGSGSSVKPR